MRCFSLSLSFVCACMCENFSTAQWNNKTKKNERDVKSTVSLWFGHTFSLKCWYSRRNAVCCTANEQKLNCQHIFPCNFKKDTRQFTISTQPFAHRSIRRRRATLKIQLFYSFPFNVSPLLQLFSDFPKNNTLKYQIVAVAQLLQNIWHTFWPATTVAVISHQPFFIFIIIIYMKTNLWNLNQ